MKKWITMVSLAVGVTGLAACSQDVTGGEVIASSSMGNITEKELYQQMKDEVGEQALQMMMIESVLQDKYPVTDEELDAQITAAIEQSGGEEEFEEILAMQGMTEESMRDQIRLTMLQENAMIADIEVSEEEIQDQYERMKKEVNAQHIVVEEEETAIEVKQFLDEGGDFNELAKEHSTDPSVEENEGELDFFGTGMMDPAFEEVAFNLEENTISEPVQSSFGWHIIKVLETREADVDLESFEDMRDQIERDLKLSQADDDQFPEILAEVLRNADIDVKDEEFSGAFDDLLEVPEEDVEQEEESEDDQEADEEREQ